MATKITNQLIQLPPEVSIDRVVNHPHSIEIFLSYPEQPRRCPFCGSSDCVIKDSGRWNVNRFHCNISDGSIGCVIDILPRMDLEYLLAYFRDYSPEQRHRTRFFCCNMHGGFISFSKRCLPDVIVCVFHVVRLLNDNVNEIRYGLQKAFRSDGDETSYQILKRSAKLLTTSASNQEEYRKGSFPLKTALLEHALALSGDLWEAYNALTEFHGILEESAYSVQRTMLIDWLDTYTASSHEALGGAPTLSGTIAPTSRTAGSMAEPINSYETLFSIIPPNKIVSINTSVKPQPESHYRIPGMPHGFCYMHFYWDQLQIISNITTLFIFHFYNYFFMINFSIKSIHK